MKKKITVLTLAFAATLVFSISAFADIQFVKGGILNSTTQADAVHLTGKEGEILFNSLNTEVLRDYPGKGSNTKVVHLDGKDPSTDSFLVCTQLILENDFDCYLGKIK